MNIAEADPVETNNATNGGSEEEDDSEDDDIQITIDHNKIDEAKTSYQVYSWFILQMQEKDMWITHSQKTLTTPNFLKHRRLV